MIRTRNIQKALVLGMTALALAGCATAPIHDQHSYEQLEFSRGLNNELGEAEWLIPEGEEPGRSDVEMGMMVLGGPLMWMLGPSPEMRRMRTARHLQQHLSSPEGRPALMTLSGFPHMSDAARAHGSDLAIVTRNAVPGIDFETSMGEMTNPAIGFLGGAAAGFGVGADAMSGANCSGDAGALCLVFAIGLLATTTAGGAVIGTVNAEANRQELRARERFIEGLDTSLHDAQPLADLAAMVELELIQSGFAAEAREITIPIAAQPLQSESREEVEGITALSAPGTWHVAGGSLPGAIPEAAGLISTERLYEAIEAGGGSVLELALPHVGLYPIEGRDGMTYSLAMVAEFAVAIEVPGDYEPQSDEAIYMLPSDGPHNQRRFAVLWRRVPTMLPPHSLEGWSDNSAALFETELERVTQITAERIVDFAFRVKREDISGEILATRVVPIYPGTDRLTFADDLAWALNPFNFGPMPSTRQNNECEIVGVSGVTPTFEWAALPEMAGITYDLRVFDDGFRIVHRANEVTGVAYEIPEGLRPNTTYFWTVRARFKENSRTRVTDWAVCGETMTPLPFIDDQRVLEFFPFRTGHNDA